MRQSTLALAVVLAASGVAAGPASAGLIVVTPGDIGNAPATNQWYVTNLRTTPAFTSTTTGAITGANPRSGNGSIAMSLTDGTGKVDFQYLWGYDDTRTLGSLAALSYDWYRDGSSTNPGTQQPALRLLYDADGDAATLDDTGYLVWEAVYNGLDPVTEDAWVTSDLIDDNFWMRTFAPGVTIEEFGISLDEWASTGASSLLADVLSADTAILGLEFGIGSGWNGQFLGNVDNVSFGFHDEDVTTFNFELRETTVPEPGTLALLALGAVSAGAVRRRRG